MLCITVSTAINTNINGQVQQATYISMYASKTVATYIHDLQMVALDHQYSFKSKDVTVGCNTQVCK